MKNGNSSGENGLIKITIYAVKIFVFPLLSHKKHSDRLGKHKNWSKKQDFILTNLAILIDIGINVWIAILAFSDYKTAILLKLVHIFGSEIFPPIIAAVIRKLNLVRRS